MMHLGKFAAFCGVFGLWFFHSGELRALESYIEITGNVTFERRMTVVLLQRCVGIADLRCPQPEQYWTVVFESDRVRYELERPFAKGSAVAPEYVELDGVLLRPGTRVFLEGIVEPVSEDYAFLTKIRRLNLVMDRLAHRIVDPDVVFPQWECTGIIGEDAQVIAEVWYSGRGRSVRAHKLQVLAQNREGKWVDLAALHDVIVTSDRDWLVYTGTSHLVSADLSIQQTGKSIQNLPGMLKLKRIKNQNQIVVPLEAAIELKCGLVRPENNRP